MIDRIELSALTRKAFHERYRRRGAPVVITGAFDTDAGWDLDFITARLGERIFTARFYGEERFNTPKTEWKEYCSFRPITFGEYAGMIRDRTAHRERVYLAQVEVGDTDLSRSVRPRVEAMAERLDLERAMDMNLWVGPSGHTEPLHFDSHDGTLIQMRGSKRVALFPPEQTENLYPFPLFGSGLAPWFSQVYIDSPDLDRYPRVKEALASRIDLVLSPGEMLFIPANWWHEVTALGDDYVCSVNRFWKVRPFPRALPTGRAATIFLSAKVPPSILFPVYRKIAELRARLGGRP